MESRISIVISFLFEMSASYQLCHHQLLVWPSLLMKMFLEKRDKLMSTKDKAVLNWAPVVAMIKLEFEAVEILFMAFMFFYLIHIPHFAKLAAKLPKMSK